MKRALVASVALLLVASHAGAAVIDGFEGAWTDNYTFYGNAARVLTNTATGSTGATPLGSALGTHTKVSSPSSNRSMAFLWNAGQTMSNGQTVDGWVALVTSSADAGGIVIKTIDYGSGLVGGYICQVAEGFNNQVQVQVVAHALNNNGGGASWDQYGAGAVKLTGHTDYVISSNYAYTSGEWYHLSATYVETDASTNTITVVVTKGTPGSETPVTTLTYVDTGTNAGSAQGSGQFGWYSNGWNNAPDFDDLGYVPEPATMGLLAIGGVLALLRRRR